MGNGDVLEKVLRGGHGGQRLKELGLNGGHALLLELLAEYSELGGHGSYLLVHQHILRSHHGAEDQNHLHDGEVAANAHILGELKAEANEAADINCADGAQDGSGGLVQGGHVLAELLAEQDELFLLGVSENHCQGLLPVVTGSFSDGVGEVTGDNHGHAVDDGRGELLHVASLHITEHGCSYSSLLNKLSTTPGGNHEGIRKLVVLEAGGHSVHEVAHDDALLQLFAPLSALLLHSHGGDDRFRSNRLLGLRLGFRLFHGSGSKQVFRGNGCHNRSRLFHNRSRLFRNRFFHSGLFGLLHGVSEIGDEGISGILLEHALYSQQAYAITFMKDQMSFSSLSSVMLTIFSQYSFMLLLRIEASNSSISDLMSSPRIRSVTVSTRPWK